MSLPVNHRSTVANGFAVLCSLLMSAPALAQRSPADSAAADSVRAQRLGTVRVEVTRTGGTLERLAWAVGAQTSVDLRRAQATLGIDEALNNIPGVVVSNRYNYAVDQRLSIRGAGSRANFGLRGVKVLLDGVPQSLPDGQSQLTNIDLASIGRVEVLRGSASSLYGNGSGGVIAFTSDLTSPDRLGASLRVVGGSFGTAKSYARVSGRSGATVGALSASRTTVDGSRQYSAADLRQLNAAVDHSLGDRVTLSLRGGTAETPRSLNPGALTQAEYELNRDTAALNNVRRGASKETSQRYLSLRARRLIEGGEVSASLYGQRRFVTNALAVAPPAPAGPANGTFSTIDRRVTGMRTDVSREFAARWKPRLAGGFDLQRAFDVRRNERTTGGRPVAPEDTLLLFQDETMTSFAPFVQVQFDPHPRVTLSAGGRRDEVRFTVEDRFFTDGSDETTERLMSAATGHLGAVWRVSTGFVPYANLSSAFETPTTTEIVATADPFFADLDPQRIRTVEVGARGRFGRAAYEVALFDAFATDAIVQYLQTDGRAFFRNAGETRSRGVEVGLTGHAAPWLELRLAYTHADYRFTEYRVPSASQPAPALDTLDGNFLAGVPANVLRLGARTLWRGFSLDVDHTLQAGLWADDRNSVRVEDWGAGQLNARLGWNGTVAGWRVEPFVAVNNALDTDYVGAVTLNGFGGRVLEPAPLRNWYLGFEVGAPILR
jgi:iron complex outermembrane receptor protein